MSLDAKEFTGKMERYIKQFLETLPPEIMNKLVDVDLEAGKAQYTYILNGSKRVQSFEFRSNDFIEEK